jgi:hypothetical protein
VIPKPSHHLLSIFPVISLLSHELHNPKTSIMKSSPHLLLHPSYHHDQPAAGRFLTTQNSHAMLNAKPENQNLNPELLKSQNHRNSHLICCSIRVIIIIPCCWPLPANFIQPHAAAHVVLNAADVNSHSC